MVQRKSQVTLGLEKLLNDPTCSPLTNPQVYKQLIKSTDQSLTETLKHLGKGKQPKPPTDDDKSKSRLATLQEKSES